MSKKFFDIFPPKYKQSSRPEDNITEQQSELPQLSPRKKIILGVAAFVFITGILLYFKLPRLNLEIWPQTDLLNLNEKIIIDKTVDKIDLENKIIPAEIIEEEKELWQEFSSTGSATKEGKAEGIIRLYNKYNPPTPISLKATTRFLSDSGKYFRAPDKIYIPVAQIKNGKVVPSSVDVKVEAIEAGDEYNIDPAKFSVPGLVGTPYYYSIYGESLASMKGGFAEDLRQVTQLDLQEAENNTTKKLLNDIESSLRNKISSEYILLDNAISKEVTEATPLVKAGATVEKFKFEAKAKARALVFKKSELENFIKEFIRSRIGDSKKIFEESLKINYTPERVDLSEGNIVLDTTFSIKVYPAIDNEKITNLLGGKSAGEIKETIYRNFPREISQVQINFWPFWVKNAPKDIKRINIKLNLE